MFTATLHFTQDRECILEELTAEVDEAVRVDIEEHHDEQVTFVLRAGEHAARFGERLAAAEAVERVVRLDEDNLLVTKTSCGAYDAIDRNHGVLRRANTVHGRQRVYHVLVFSRADLRAIIEDMREFGTLTLDRLQEVGGTEPRLTDRQRDVVTAALEEGYFAWPREITAEELAAELGISRATFHEHLRKGQRKLLRDALSTETGSDRADPAAWRARYSEV